MTLLGGKDLPEWEQGVRQGGNMDIPAMTKNLLDYKKVMDKYGVKFVLFFGTLLGLVRQQGFIKYDTDVDVLVFSEDYLPWLKAKAELKELGFVISDNVPLHDEHCIRDGEKIEMWWCDDVRDEVVYNNQIRFKNDLIFPTQDIEFLGQKFLIPNSSEKILEMIYGSTWKEPNPNTKGSAYIA